MSTLTPNTPFFVFDVESIGLHGEGFAVAGGVYINGIAHSEFHFACPANAAGGDTQDRDWVLKNIPAQKITHKTSNEIQDAFWVQWAAAKNQHPGILMAAECGWPVEANFLSSCIYQREEARKFAGPYPCHEIASFMLAAGMDPMATYDRLPSELPKHDPLADARQSARLLFEALHRLHPTAP